MKKVRLFLLVATLAFSGVSLTSCSSDDDSNTPVEVQPQLVGKWYFSRTGSGFQGSEIYDNYTHETGCTKDHVELMQDGMYKGRRYSGDECTLQETSSTWSLANNILTVTNNNVTTVYEVTSLTASQLKLRTAEVNGDQTFYNIYEFTRS